MDISIVFGGVVVSLIVELLKRWFGTDRLVTIAICVGLSLVGGVAYMVLNHLGFLQQAIQLFAVAGSFYAFIIKSFEAK